MDKASRIGLTEALPYLENSQGDNIILFANPSGQLETFFNYKGRLIEIYKEKMKIDIGKNSIEEVGEEIRALLISGIQYGYSIVLDTGSSENFDIDAFFSKFKWYKSDLFANKNFLNTAYLKKNNMIKPEEDKDHFGNTGGYKCNEAAKIFILTLTEENNLPAFIKANSKITFETLIVN